MYEKNFNNDFSIFVSSANRAMLRVAGPQGKALPFSFSMQELEEFQKFIDWALGRMYVMEKRDYDGKIEEAFERKQTEMDL